MTKVYLDQHKNRFTVQCKGHATGSPEMCAAVSCLVQTLAAWVKQAPVTVLGLKLDEADALVDFAGGKAAETVFDMMCVGFGSLQATDPARIQVEISVS